MDALIGKKIGMTQVFDESGNQIPVTAIEVGPCVVTQRKTAETDGYDAAQLGYQEKKESRTSKPMAGHFKKAETSPKQVLREVRLEDGAEVKVGDVFTASVFENVSHVDVIGTTKGRGFQGVVKRHGMSGGRASHGSGMHRRSGSIGMCVSPARVLKGKKMPGHMGNARRTVQNLRVVQVREDDNLLLVRGSIPGATGSVVFVRKSIKKADKAAS
jgi:large subunit ribosomal protein L3